MNENDYIREDRADGSILFIPKPQPKPQPKAGEVWKDADGDVYVIGAENSMCLSGVCAFHGGHVGEDEFYDECDVKLADSLDEYYEKVKGFIPKEELRSTMDLFHNHNFYGLKTYLYDHFNL